jgi:protein arginine kinase
MQVREFLSVPSDNFRKDGPHINIVMSSRVRLARNLASEPFPGWAKKSQRIASLKKIRPSVEAISHMKNGFSDTMDNLNSLEKQVLVERHLISKEHASKGGGSGIVLNKQQNICVLINEEDHLRIQVLKPGLQLKEAWKQIDALDTNLEKKLKYSFDSELGYLTACPTNLGTGIRVSAMLHLPGLVLSEQVNQVISAVNKLGLAVRGIYGEGSEALGNVFQVSNQMTLGETEKEIVDRINKVLQQIIEHEENARETLLENKPNMVFHQIGRAYGILSNSYIISSKETMNLLSFMRLGVELEIFGNLDRSLVDELFVATQPAHLQKNLTEKLSAEERDLLRAEILRDKFKGIEPPDPSRLKPVESENETENEEEN